MRAEKDAGSKDNAAGAHAARELIAAVVNACAETKGQDITVLDVSRVFSLSDYFVLVSGRSDRQVQGISHKILTALEQRSVTPFSVEGLEKAHWVLIDCGEFVVHVFYEPLRLHYDLESLWNGARKLDIAKEITPLVPARRAA